MTDDTLDDFYLMISFLESISVKCVSLSPFVSSALFLLSEWSVFYKFSILLSFLLISIAS